VKHRFLALLLAIQFALVFGQEKDVFANNHTIQNEMKRFGAVYSTSIGEYLGEWFDEAKNYKGSIYDISYLKADALVRDYQKRGLAYYAFKIEQNFNIGKKLDKIAIMEIHDQIDLLRKMMIQGNDFEISNSDVVNWFIKWRNEFEYRITGVGIDFIEADIITEPKDYLELAKEIYSMCPDVVDQGTNTVEELAKELRTSKVMYFWWD
jgi:hypothetical protein